MIMLKISKIYSRTDKLSQKIRKFADSSERHIKKPERLRQKLQRYGKTRLYFVYTK